MWDPSLGKMNMLCFVLFFFFLKYSVELELGYYRETGIDPGLHV